MTIENFDVLQSPLRDVPFTLIATYPIGHIFYFEFPSEPSIEQYAAAGVAISERMLRQIGKQPSSWLLRPTAEVNLDFFRDGPGPEPVLVR